MDRTVPQSAAYLLGFIRATEVGSTGPASYNVIYGHNERKLPKPITSMTVAEVQAQQAGFTSRFGSSATGGYQFMRDTLAGLRKELRLRDGQIFDANLQDRLAYHLLKRRGYEAWAAGRLSDVEFAKRLAMEWASFPVLRATRGAHRNISRGQSYYAGDGLNKALVKPEQIEALLREAKALPHVPPIPSPTPAPVEPQMPPTTPPVAQPDPVLPPKPWYLSKGAIGGLLAAILPIVAIWMPGAQAMDPNNIADVIVRAVELATSAAGALAFVGRLAASRPIAGTARARAVEEARYARESALQEARAEVPPGYVPESAAPVHEPWNASDAASYRSVLTPSLSLEGLDDIPNAVQRVVGTAQAVAPVIMPVLTALVAAARALEQRERVEPDPQP